MSEILLKHTSEIIDSKKYSKMLDKISSNLDYIEKSSRIFYKPYSQFKNSTLDISNLSIEDSLKHVLAVIEQEKLALQQASIDLKREQIKIKYMLQKLSLLKDGEDKELLILDIEEKENKISNSKNYVLATIRKLSFMIEQYNNIIGSMEGNFISEEEFEISEIKTHIKRAFNQALCAARSRGGLIDEGNQIYLSQLGINGAVAQAEVSDFLNLELQMLESGKMPTQIMVMEWLNSLSEKYYKCPEELTNYRGLSLMDRESLV